MSGHRLMLAHAHPDDESSQSPATMSRYVDEGIRVTPVTCTLGELGEILVPEQEHYTLEELGAKRVDEPTKALKIIGVTGHVWLGGKGRYHSSDMTIDGEGRVILRDELSDGASWTTDLLEVSDHLVALIRDRRLQVIAIYDQNSNYGHPDYIQAHRVTIYTTMLAGVSSYRPDLGGPRQVSRVLWISLNPQAWSKAAEKIHELGMPLPKGTDEKAMRRRFAIDPRHIATVILYEGHVDLCQVALETYRNQADLGNPLWKIFCFMRTVEGTSEVYHLATGVPFPGDGSADDLFAGPDV